MDEVWQPVPGHSGYEASSLGRIRSVERVLDVRRSYGGHVYQVVVPGKLIKGCVNSFGYIVVKLGKYGRRVMAHRVIALTFIPNPEKKPQVNHIDGNKLNARVDNLEWVTNDENMAHAVRTGLIRAGERHPGRKLTLEQVYDIREKYSRGDVSMRSLAKEMGVTHHTISRVVNGVSWK